MPKASLLLRLLLAGGVVAILAPIHPAAAQAAPVFAGSGVFELVPPTGIVGDGATAADLYLLALAADGSPITGIKGKPVVTGGTAGDIVEVGGGIYRFTFTAAKVDQRGTASLTLKTKLGKESVTKAWNVSVAPPKSHTLAVAANPGRMTLGQDRTATISINLAGGDRQGLQGVDLKVNASAGTVENLTNLGGGQFTALYTAPAVNFPHVAILTVVDRRDPTHTYGSLAIPLVGKVEYPVTVAPGARVVMKIGDQQFGPIQSDAQGRARVPILVPPGATIATVTQIGADGKSVDSALDLKVPEARRVSMFPTNTAIPSDGRINVPVRVLVTTADGKAEGNAQVALTATAGAISVAKHEGGGVYVATFTPPFGNAPTQATIAANVNNSPLQSDSLAINLVPVRAAKVQLTAEPATLAAGADGFKIFTKVTGPDGSGLGSRGLTFSANGARLKGDVKDLRNGDYQALFTTTGSGPVELTATVSAAVTGNPLNRVLLVPARARLPGDGLSSNMITVATVDEFGYPVPNVEVSLRLTSGDGAVPATTKTGSDGMAAIYYTAGRNASMVGIEASSGDMIAAAAFLQVPDAVVVPRLPVSGPKAEADLIAEWGLALGASRIERDGMSGAIVPIIGPVSIASVGLPTKAGMVSDPATVSAGGSVKLKVTVSDEAGKGVGGQGLDFLVSAGSVGPVSDLGGGQYEAMLAVPTTASGEVKVSVATRDGSVSSFMRIPIGGAEAAWSAANPFTTQPDPYAVVQPTPQPVAQPTPVAQPVPTPQPTPVAQPTPIAQPTTVTTVNKAPPAKGDHAWFRGRGGYMIGGYTYTEAPLTQATVLYPKPFTIGAVGQGYHAQVRAFLPMFEYVGVDVDVHGSSYTIDPVGLCQGIDRPCDSQEPVADWYTTTRAVVVGRYPFEVGSSQFHVGLRAGVSESDVQVFTVISDAINLDQLALVGLAAGAELGADLKFGQQNVFFVTHFTENLAGGTTPYNHEFGAEIGWAILDPMFVSASYDLAIRTAQVQNDKGAIVGQIDDTLHGGTIAVGVQF